MKTYTKSDCHNPENLTRQQVGEQHRLLLPEEVDGRFRYGMGTQAQCVGTDENMLWTRAEFASCQKNTYRVPLATPLPDGTVLTSNECCFSESVAQPKRKRIYVAGGMTGYDDFNFTTFFAASESLARQGWEPVNPAQLDIDANYPLERLKQLTPDEFQEFLRGAIKRDLEAIETCDAIALLPGWESSKGARAEKALAEWMGLEVYGLIPGTESDWWHLVGEINDDGSIGWSQNNCQISDENTPRFHPNDPKGAIGATKPPMHLLPPDALIETAKAMGYGSQRYGPWNFIETKVCASTYIGAIGRHWCAWSKGENSDADSGLSHLAHIAANCFIVMTAMQQETLLDDRPKLK